MQAGKLHTLKKWLTVSEAAQHLTTALGELVADADVLRLGLDGHLAISVSFANPTPAIPCTGQAGEAIVMLSGVHDLPMTGLERHDVQCRHHSMLGLPWVIPQGVEEVLVQDSDGQVYALRQGFGYSYEAQTREIAVPMGSLPEDSFLVVRPESLASFVESMDSESPSDEDGLEGALREAGANLDVLPAKPSVAAGLAGSAETPEQRRARLLDVLEAEERSGGNYGALARASRREGVDRSNMSKLINKARAERTEKARGSMGWGSQLAQVRKRTG